MKRYISMIVALMITALSFAQDVSIQSGGVPSGNGADDLNSVYTLIITICAAAFLFVVVYALARAVKALSSQVSS